MALTIVTIQTDSPVLSERIYGVQILAMLIFHRALQTVDGESFQERWHWTVCSVTMNSIEIVTA